MRKPKMTEATARAAAEDAADRQMKKAGREKWNREDYNLAVETFNRLWPQEPIQDRDGRRLGKAAMGHTPGPWTAKKCETSERWYVEIRENGYKAPIVFPSGICGDARHIGGERFQGTEEANARLIAAAPDLAAALRELAEIGERGVIERRETGKPTWSALEAMATIARAALSRAGY